MQKRTKKLSLPVGRSFIQHPTGHRSFLARFAWWLRRRRNEASLNRAYTPPRSLPGPTRGPLISLILPAHNTPQNLLADAIASVRAQTYQDWQLCIADDGSSPPIRIPQDPRITLTTLPATAGIAAASNAALAQATGAYAGFLDHDDTLAPEALSVMAQAIAEHPDASIFFSDEDQLTPHPSAPYFKPGWNPDLLLAQNLVCHLALYRRSLLTTLGGLAAGYDGSQDWELALRAAAAATVRHVPAILYHWRQSPTSYSAIHTASTRDAALRAVQAHLPPGATATPNPTLPQWNRVTYPLPTQPPRLSLILPKGAKPPAHTYPTTEIVPEAAHARGEIIIFLYPNLQAITPDWLQELASQILRPEIGTAGARIDVPNGRVAQSGLILDAKRITQTLTSQADPADPGYRGHFVLARNVSATSPHCLAISRATFEAHGLNPTYGAHAHTDLCLRLAASGLRHIWTPHAHLAYTSLPKALPPNAAMLAQWGAKLASDPYLNPHLEVHHGQLRQVRKQFFFAKKNQKTLVS